MKKYKDPKCGRCDKPYPERWQSSYCLQCCDIILEEKIANRSTDLQSAFDMACEEEKEIEAEIEKQILHLESLKNNLKNCRKLIDKCINRERELGITVL